MLSAAQAQAKAKLPNPKIFTTDSTGLSLLMKLEQMGFNELKENAWARGAKWTQEGLGRREHSHTTAKKANLHQTRIMPLPKLASTTSQMPGLNL